jgi:hypothetical protein
VIYQIVSIPQRMSAHCIEYSKFFITVGGEGKRRQGTVGMGEEGVSLRRQDEVLLGGGRGQ